MSDLAAPQEGKQQAGTSCVRDGVLLHLYRAVESWFETITTVALRTGSLGIGFTTTMWVWGQC